MGSRPVRTDSCLVVIAARNEAKTIGQIVYDIKSTIGADVLVVVNPSTDDTALAARAAGAEVISNEADLNIGGSLLIGYDYAVRHEYDTVCQMDAGGSHRVEDLAIGLSTRCWPISIGSRLMKSSLFGQSFMRKVLTYLAAIFGWALSNGGGLRDYTSGLRIYDISAVKEILSASRYFSERGHSFNWRCAVGLARTGMSIEWFPIQYVATNSSLSWRSLCEAFWSVVMEANVGSFHPHPGQYDLQRHQ